MRPCSSNRQASSSVSLVHGFGQASARSCLVFSAASLALTFAVGSLATGQTPVAAKPPESRSYPRLFRTAADMLESQVDPRLDLPSGNGTIEFWAGRNWPLGGATELFCVVANGEPGQRQSAAGVAEPIFEPRYAIYLSQQLLYFQTGEDVYSVPLSLDPYFDFQAEKAHFAVVIRGEEKLIDVFVNGQPGSTIENVQLKGHGVGRVTVGGLETTTGKAQLRFGSEKPKQLDLAKVVKPYRGNIADLRIWSKDFDSRIFLSGLEPAPLLQRNQHDIERTIAFGGVNEDSTVTRPTYEDLVLYSSFRGDKDKHSLKLQYGIEGHWLNASRQSPRMDSEMEAVLGDSLGNVVLPWNITILPATPDRAAWLVYLDSNYTGYIADSGDDDESLVFIPADSKSGPERKFMVQGDSLRMLDAVPSIAFGGFNGAPTAQIELVRPTSAWMGKAVDADDVFWKSDAVGYMTLCYKAYNPPKMPSKNVHLGEHGDTGSSKFIFKEPVMGDYRWNQSAKRVLPNTLAFINIASGSGTEISTTAFTEEEAVTASSMKFGASLSIDALVTIDRNINSSISNTETQLLRSETVETNSCLILKSYALVLDMSRAELEPEFVSRIEALRDSTDLDRDYDSFIQEVGTHYTAAVTYGAMAESIYQFSKEDVQSSLAQGFSFESVESNGINAPTTVTANGSPFGAGVNVGVTNNNKVAMTTNESKDNSFNQSRKEARSKSSRKTYVYGTTTIAADGSSLSADNPVPLFFDLRPVYELLSPHHFSDPRILDEVRPRLKAKILGALNAPLAKVLKTRVVPPEAGASASPKIAAYKEVLRSRLAASEIAGLLVPPDGPLDEPLTAWTAAGPYLRPLVGEAGDAQASAAGDAAGDATAERLLASRFLPQSSPGADWILWSSPASTPQGALDLSGIETDSIVYFRNRFLVRRPVELTLRLEGSPRHSRVYVNGSPAPASQATAPGAALFDVRFERGWTDLVVEKALVDSDRQPLSVKLTDDSVWALACLGELNSATANQASSPEAPVNLLATRGQDDALALVWSYPLPKDAAELGSRLFEVERISPTPFSVLTASPQFVDSEGPASAVYRVRATTPTGWGRWSPFLVVGSSPKTSGG